MDEKPNPGWPREQREISPERQALAERLLKHIDSKGVSLGGSDPMDWLLNTSTVGSWMFHFLADEIEAARDGRPAPAAKPTKTAPVKPAPAAEQNDLFGG